MNISERTAKLRKALNYNAPSVLDDSPLEIIPFSFRQEMGVEDIESLHQDLPKMDFCSSMDHDIKEDKDFTYFVFNPKGKVCSSKAILLLHGLNERSWDKYLTWAEDLALKLGVPVILFPIAFHMNRTPEHWIAPRTIMPWVSLRRNKFEDLSDSTFCNLALSSRISSSPERFYISGRETIFNICQLVKEIKDGRCQLFRQDIKIDIFAYSIGALLSQALLISNPFKLFSDSKLFTFCGGSIFESMNGIAKDIMDSEAFGRLQSYYMKNFLNQTGDFIKNAFRYMVSASKFKIERESFFTNAHSRIKMITLKKDLVIPTLGALNAVGNMNKNIVEELDFPYEYSHQMPFPLSTKINPELISKSFRMVFDRAESFLAY